MTAAEAFDKRGAEIGRKLDALAWEVLNLSNDINFGPDLSDEEQNAFDIFRQVQKLIEVAVDLYPYYGEDE